jgi:GDP-L-fucose synthase
MMNPSSKIYLSGHTGLVGSAIMRKLISDGYTNIITRRSIELDLRNQQQVNDFFEKEKPEYVFFASAKVGGVLANNTYRADFIYSNLAMQINIIHGAYLSGVKKLMFMGSNCLYPKLAAQPIKEEYLLAGKLESTTESYAIAKIAGIKMCEAYRCQYGCNFISILPVNMYG